MYTMSLRLFVCSVLFGAFSACNPVPAPATHAQHGTHGSGYVDSVNNGSITADTLKGSPARVSMATIGDNHIHITYHSPGVKGRVIWGGLVPYNQVWVTGAHSATTVSFSHPVTIAGNKVDAGTYAVFTIPGETTWKFLLNKNHRQHLTDEYNAGEDVLNIPVTPETVALTPRLTYAVQQDDEQSGSIIITWEKKQLHIPFTNMP